MLQKRELTIAKVSASPMSHLMLKNSLLLLIFLCLHSALAREWRDSGTGTIVLEEAWTIPELVDQATG